VQEVDWTRPTAFVLGNEREGVSATAVALADATAIIPMAGEGGHTSVLQPPSSNR
jgi:tRNA (guanosine-2'-O-)-methyltransferase